jgi:hypothetical protein
VFRKMTPGRPSIVLSWKTFQPSVFLSAGSDYLLFPIMVFIL